jgi:uncharacterized Ntn-hydrolase superfamily protein
MKRLILTLSVLVCASPAYATWSVIALDRRTKTVVIASATCVTASGLASRGGLKGIQAIVVPGKAVAAAQANVDATHANQMLIYTELGKGTAPTAILDLLRADPQIESRQFGILDMQGRFVGFSGTANQSHSLDVQGQVPGTLIYYSIQGNILASDDVVHAAETALRSTPGQLTDRVMAAMEVADREGGDSRCSCDKPPKIDAPCTAKTAHVSYILRAENNDKVGVSHNDGQYAMYVSVTDQDIKPTENANPVITLRMRYDAWMKAHK